MFGDTQANVYGVDAQTGAQLWKMKVDDHAFARITGAPTFANGRLYVPVSSVEEVPAARPNYACCTFRGSVVALDAATGVQLWKSYMIPDAPQIVGKNSAGTPHGSPPAPRSGRRRRSISPRTRSTSPPATPIQRRLRRPATPWSRST